MEELTKFHIDWKKIVVVGLLVVLTGVTTGGLTWYVADSGRDAELDAKDQTIADLETRIKQLESANAETTVKDRDKSSTNIFDLTTVKVGDKIAGMTVVSVGKSVEDSTVPYGKENATVVFSGQATLVGEYEYSPFAIVEDWLSFKPNSTTANLIPREVSESETGFLFKNNDSAIKMLGIERGKDKTGNASITIKDYTFSIVPGEGANTATLVSVK